MYTVLGRSDYERKLRVLALIAVALILFTLHNQSFYASADSNSSDIKGPQESATVGVESTEDFLNGDSIEFTGPVEYVERGVSTKVISGKLTKEQRCDVDTAYRFFIYLMDKEGYVPNAIIGAMTYMMCEGGSYSDIMQGTYTYQSDWIYGGPSGVRMDKTEDNAAWLRWLNGKGFDDAVYDNGNCNIGLGLTQESDVWWYSRDNKTTHNATALITAAIAEGVSWQDPAFQVDYIINNKFSQNWAWDLDSNPGPDPKSSSEVSALEWATRVWCGVGMPSYNMQTAPELHPDGYATHVANLSRATQLYYRYTGVDTWFYKPEADWHNPFAGPVVEDTTDAGLLIARTALLLSADNKVYLTDKHSYDAPEFVKENSLQYYRRASHSIGKTITETGDYAATADIAVSTVVLLSGVDPDFERLYPGKQREYMLASDRWEYLGNIEDVHLQPGDILVELSPSDPDGAEPDTARHISIYVGSNVAVERWKKTDVNVFDASLAAAGTPNAYYPCMSNKSSDSLAGSVVFRCVTPLEALSDKYWVKFYEEYGSLFPELPVAYQAKYTF